MGWIVHQRGGPAERTTFNSRICRRKYHRRYNISMSAFVYLLLSVCLFKTLVIYRASQHWSILPPTPKPSN